MTTTTTTTTPTPIVHRLPYELLTSILSYLRTPLLPPLRLVSPTFRSAIDGLIYTRFKGRYNTLDQHDLIFECFLPNERTSVPYYECVYRGSKRAVEKGKEGGVLEAGWKPLEGELGEPENREEVKGLSGWFSFFVPVDERAVQYQEVVEGEEEEVAKDLLSGIGKPQQTVIVRPNEVFVELCPQASLVKKAGERRLLKTVVSVFSGDKARLSRDWLRRQAAKMSEMSSDEYEGEWVQIGKRGDVAIRMKVYQDNIGGYSSGEDGGMGTMATYKLAYEEVMIKTGLLLLILEESRDEELAYGDAARAIIYGGL